MIVISNPTLVKNEIKLIHSLFAEGLTLFHVRKPHFSEDEIKTYLLEIGLEYNHRLVLHSHHQLAEDFGINRIHFTEENRKHASEEKLKYCEEKNFHLSTSIHKIDDYEILSNAFEYAFLSPVFRSISKPNYVPSIDFKTEIKSKKKKIALVALGGIATKTVKIALEYGFDDVALLGTIWNSNNPIENFKICQQIAHLY